MTNRCLVYLFVFGAKVITSVVSSTIDEIILNATETKNESAYLQSTDGEVKGKFDIIFTAEQWKEIQQLTGNKIYDSSRSRHKRKAIRDERYRWTDGVIPYKIAPNVFTPDENQTITKALEEWQNYTCISFRPALSSDTNFTVFDDGDGCLSWVGMIGGNQTVKLPRQTGCRTMEVILHEVGHVVGFWHEQSRPDRDDYVEIISQNIIEKEKNNFINYTSTYLNVFGIPYDYESIMHYKRKEFSKNGNDTIRTKDPKYQDVIGNAKSLSFRDIKLANLMYNCSKKAGCRDVTCPGEGFLNKNCECMCPGSPVRNCPGTTPVPGDGARTETSAGYESKPCVDKNSSCEYWGSKGFCQGKYIVYMSSSCPKTCGLCSLNDERVSSLLLSSTAPPAKKMFNE